MREGLSCEVEVDEGVAAIVTICRGHQPRICEALIISDGFIAASIAISSLFLSQQPSQFALSLSVYPHWARSDRDVAFSPFLHRGRRLLSASSSTYVDT